MSCRDVSSCQCNDSIETSKHVFIELTSACNFNCDFCPHRYMTRSKGIMDLKVLDKALRGLSRFNPDYVMFSAMGEPTLHPEFARACQMVKDAGHRLIVTTNGSILNEEMHALPIDELYISLMTPTSSSFSLRDSSMSFEDYILRIKEFVQKVSYATTIYVMKEDLHLYPDIKDVVSDMNKATMVNQIAKIFFPESKISFSDSSYVQIAPKVNIYIKPMGRWAQIESLEGKIGEAKSIPFCSYYIHHINILQNGDVTFCCMDYDGKMALGNLKDGTLEEIYSKKLCGIDLNKYEYCRKCRGDIVCP